MRLNILLQAPQMIRGEAQAPSDLAELQSQCSQPLHVPSSLRAKGGLIPPLRAKRGLIPASDG